MPGLTAAWGVCNMHTPAWSRSRKPGGTAATRLRRMTHVVETSNLTKRYGARAVVAGLDLRIPQGAVYGFLGPNGSGKSTTMKMLLSLVQPTEGRILIQGEPMNRSTRRRRLARIGSLIESPPGYGHLTGAENMRIVQRLLGLDEEDVRRAVSTVRMQKQMDKKVREYSLGMKQRLGIAMALVRRPSLLILDEPTNGLDPAGIEEIRRLLRDLAADGMTIMVSSHLLGEIDRTATVLGILSRGRLLFQGSRDDLVRASAPDLLIECSDPGTASAVLAAHGAGPGRGRDSDRDPTTRGPGGLDRPDCPGGLVRVPGLGRSATAHAVSALVRAGIDVYGVRHEKQSLEDVFMALTEGGGLRP